MKETLKIGISGVRGVVGHSFTPQLATAFAQAFGTFVGRGKVLVGRDTRTSGVMLEQAVLAGLQSVGCTPVCLDIVPTPTLLYNVPRLGARGGVMVTASHNPAEWNALKFIERRGLFLDVVRADELFDIYHQQEFPFVHEPALRKVKPYADAVDAHFDAVARYVDTGAIRRANVQVALDACNGVGAHHTRRFLENWLGCDVHAVFEEPSGEFERNPEPLAEHLDALKAKVIDSGAAIGFAQDPDGDRLAVVDEQGRAIGEDLTVTLAIQAVLEQHGAGPVVVNISMGKAIESIVQQHGQPLLRAPTGEVYVTGAMLQSGAVAGGEHTGGIIIPAIHPCRDSYAGMAVLLERLALQRTRVSQWVDALPPRVLLKHKIPMLPEEMPPRLRALRTAYADRPMVHLDGLYIDCGTGWIHARRSNTEPVMRLIVEAPDATQARHLLNEACSKFRLPDLAGKGK